MIEHNLSIKEYLTDDSTFAIWVIGYSVRILDFKTGIVYPISDWVNKQLVIKGDLDYIDFLLAQSDFSKLICYNE